VWRVRLSRDVGEPSQSRPSGLPGGHSLPRPACSERVPAVWVGGAGNHPGGLAGRRHGVVAKDFGRQLPALNAQASGVVDGHGVLERELGTRWRSGGSGTGQVVGDVHRRGAEGNAKHAARGGERCSVVQGALPWRGGGGAGCHDHRRDDDGPTLLDAAAAATYAGARPATLRVWRLPYGMTPWHIRSGANLYDLAGSQRCGPGGLTAAARRPGRVVGRARRGCNVDANR
jgi:hypothetical protein